MEKKQMIIGAVLVAAALAVGVIIGYTSRGGGAGEEGAGDGDARPLTEDSGHREGKSFHTEQDMVKEVLRDMDTGRLRSFLKYLTDQPHIAAQERDDQLTQWMMDTWLESGLDKVELATYDFYLSWPNQTNPNKVQLLDSHHHVRFTSMHKEVELREGDDNPNFIHAFNGYAPAGEVEGDLVYVNYAKVEDLEELEDMGISVEGKICMARYGKIYRGNKVRNCQDRGAIGIIMYTDPAEVAVQGVTPDKVYPNTFFLPGSGVQRGSTYIGDGDPLSPHWPSVENAYRVEPEEVDGLPRIPAQPIGYDDARVLLEKMGGRQAPKKWRGKLEGIDYNLGPEWKSEFAGWKVHLKTNNYFGTKKSSNIIGYIHGSVEPDRYVLLSNHRDAWGYGSVDPSSGTAQLMEVVRSLGKLRKKGWKPRRTLVFASWAAEEYGLEGSYEWVYDKINKITSRAVGLVNTDICVSGPIAKPQGSPVLHDVIIDGFKHADNPTTAGDEDPSKAPRRDYFPEGKSEGDDQKEAENYYDFWYRWWNQDKDEEETPKIKLLGSGTDHAPFAFYAGVPCINMRFKDDTKAHKGVGQYPTYHTGYETFYLMDEIIDPGFRIHRTCAQTSTRMLLNMADSVILPYNLNHFPRIVKEGLAALRKNNVSKLLSDNDATLTHLEEAVEEFEQASKAFMNSLDDVDLNDPIKVRIVNDQLMQLERVFVMPGGILGRPETRHAVFAPAKFNKYGGGAFPGLSDLVHGINRISGDEKVNRWKQIRQHVSDLMIMMRSAADFLTPVEDI